MIDLQFKSDNARINKVKQLIKSAGNLIGAVHFRKRLDGSKRRMSYRLGVQEPTYASRPSGKKDNRAKDEANCQITVLDVNKVRYNKKGNMSGRGDWRCIPLETVSRVAVNGQIYRIHK